MNADVTDLDVVAGALKGTYGSEFKDADAEAWRADAEFMLARFQEYGWRLIAVETSDLEPEPVR